MQGSILEVKCSGVVVPIQLLPCPKRPHRFLGSSLRNTAKAPDCGSIEHAHTLGVGKLPSNLYGEDKIFIFIVIFIQDVTMTISRIVKK